MNSRSAACAAKSLPLGNLGKVAIRRVLLVAVQHLPIVVGDVGNGPRLEQGFDSGWVAGFVGYARQGRQVLDHLADGFNRVGLVGADDAARSSLGPAGDVAARHRGAVLDDPAGGVGNHAAVVVEGQPGHRGAEIADRPQQQTCCEILLDAGGFGAHGVTVEDRPVGAESDTGDPVIPEDPNRGAEEPKHYSTFVTVLRLGGVPLQGRHLASYRGVERVAETIGEIIVFDHDVDAGQSPEFLQFRIVERCVKVGSTSHDDNLAYPAAGQRGQGVIGDVRPGELRDREGEDTGDVECDVAVADEYDPLAGQVGIEVGGIRVAVVPGDKGPRGDTAGEILAGDSQSGIPGGSGGEDNGVIPLGQLRG